MGMSRWRGKRDNWSGVIAGEIGECEGMFGGVWYSRGLGVWQGGEWGKEVEGAQ